MSKNNALIPDRQRSTSIALAQAAHALEHAHSIEDIKAVRDKVELLRQYAKRAGESLGLQNEFAVIRLEAERKAGSLLAEHGPRRGGDRKSKSKSHGATLNSIGINRSQSSRWQQESRVPTIVFARHI